MSKQAGTLELIVGELAKALRPLEDRLASGQLVGLISDLGMRLPDAVAQNSQVIGGATSSAVAAAGLGPLLTQLTDAIEAENAAEIISAGVELIQKIREVLQGMTQLASGIDAAASGGGLTPAQIGELKSFAQELPKRLFDFIVIEYLHSKCSCIVGTLNLVGLIDNTVNPGDPADPMKPPYRRRELHVKRFVSLFLDPQKYFKETFGWGDNAFDGMLLFERLKTFLDDNDLPATIITAPTQPPALEAFLFRFSPGDSTTPPGLRMRLRFPAVTDYKRTFRLSEIWSVLLETKARFEAGVEVELRPPLDVAFNPPVGNAEIEVSAGLVAEKEEGPMMLLGSAGNNGLFLQRAGFDVGVRGVWTSSSSDVRIEPTVSMNISGGRLLLNLSSGDGFIQSIASGVNIDANFDIGAEWSPSSGLHFKGSGGIEIAIPTHVNLGPLQIITIYLRSGLGPDGSIPAEISGAFSIRLGPLQASVERIGLLVETRFPEGGGNLGPADLTLRFKPPNGVGLSIDTGVIKGGGFLYLDAEKGEYMGALELDFQGMFSLKAVGIINTKMPDGSKGFSLLIIITAEFSPIQLSFGFVLIGVGGLLGLNRTTRIEVLREGVKTNALKSVLFPEDVVANINRIVSDLKQIFPPQEARFIIGPMGKIGWGTPAIITLEMGLLLEIPVPKIAILGVLKALLPEENTALLRMQINFLGVIDFENKYISFDASLYDSRLLVYTLSGDMAFRLSWGDNPLFILSVGGFHPSFKDAPADLQRMTRLSISLLSGNNPRLSVQCYFAVTSNTVQFGAKAELYAEACGFNVYGFLGFDVLFQFDPFRFIIALYAGLALRCGSSVLMSVKVAGELAGPTPWDVRGEASFSILFFDVTVSFHETWGDRLDKVEPEKIDVVALLTTEVDDMRNWKAEIPDNNNLHVTIKQIDLSKNVPKKIAVSRFENDVLNKIEGDADKQYIQAKYVKDGNDYALVEPINDTDKEKILNILKSVQFFSLIVHPFGVLQFSEQLVPLGVAIDKFGSKVPKDANKFELTEVKCNSTNLPTEVAKDKFARANFFNMKDNEKLSHASFDEMPSGFKITASNELKTGQPIMKNVDYELSYLRKKQSTLKFAGIYKLAKKLFKAAAKGSAVAKSSLSYQNTRISSNTPGAVAVLTEKYVIANVSDMQRHSPELVADSYSEASELYRELITKNPEMKDQVQVLSEYEVT